MLVNPPIIGYVEPGSEEAKLGIKEGDKIVQVNGQKIKSWQDISMATVLARTNVLPVVIEREGAQTTYHLTAEVNETLGLKLLRLEPRDHPEVIDVKPETPAAAAGLKAQDKILAFAGVPVVSREQLIDLIKQRPEKATDIRVERDGQKLALSITPKADPATKKGLIGVALGTSTTQMYVVQRPGPDPWSQVVDVVDKTVKTFSALFYSKQTGVGAKDLSGPVGILAMLAAWVNTDYRLALSFLVLLNVNLAILNLLPVPVLDGGHIMMAIIEKVRRRPLSVKFVEYSTTVFAVLLISFMLYVTVYDIKRMPLIGSWFKSKTTIEQAEPTSPPGN
jgi:regulator of sigma E protease